jgi:dihydroorotate dehydrogenase
MSEIKINQAGLVIKGRSYGIIFCAVGARGFFKEGYPFHTAQKLRGMNWEGTSFVSKTKTAKAVIGNMPLKNDGTTPQELIPQCIWAEGKSIMGITIPNKDGHMLNCVGLSNFGLEYYLKQGIYQTWEENFMISIMANEKENKVGQIQFMCKIIETYLGNKQNFCIQINFDCPNTGNDAAGEQSIIDQLEIARISLPEHIGIVANFNALRSTELLVKIESMVDAYWIGNTIPFGQANDVINLDNIIPSMQISGKYQSPLSLRGMPAPGGLSGPECLPLTLNKIEEMRKSGIKKPICGGNSVRKPEDIQKLKDHGANAAFIGTVGVHNPGVMCAIIIKAHEIF